jgi:hypothetical protein
VSMILSWAVFPLALAAVGLGWGALVGWAAGEREMGVLTIPLGLAAALVVAALFTMFSFSAPAAAPVVAGGGVVGLARAWRRVTLAPAALVAAVAVLLIYGAPVILSGQDTFLGYVRLDDTATWLGFIDQFFAHGRSLSTLPSSTYQLLLNANLTQAGYPSGAFMLAGVGHWITGIDAAWIFQPYLAVCAAALALCCWDLLAPIVAGVWLRAFVAFIAAQSALLYGYAAWGGIKELTAAFVFALGIAVTARLIAAERPGPRASVPLAVAGGALIATLGPGVAVYMGPAGLVLAAVVLWRSRHGIALTAGDVTAGRRRLAVSRLRRGVTRRCGPFVAIPLTALLAMPSWLTLSAYLRANSTFATASTTSVALSTNHATAYGNLISALRAIQLSGIWIDSDFRGWPSPPPSLINHLLIYWLFAGALFALGWTLWRRSLGLALYVGVALASIAILSLLGSVPWVMGKSLSISSPAVLLAGMTGGAILFNMQRVAAVIAGVLLLGAIAGGVLWSNYLQYHNVTLAPRARLSELQQIGTLVAGRGPTFVNEYEIYADRHFLRAGAPIEPAEYRSLNLPTLGNAYLTDPAWANIDSFGLATLGPYRSLVIRIGPTESRPPSIYGLKPVYSGRYYELWQQPARPTVRVVAHEPLGDTLNDAYCGNASNVTPAYSPVCPIAPAAVPACAEVRALASTASADGGYLLAYERPNPIVARGSAMQFSAADWYSNTADGTLTPTVAGASAVAHVVTGQAPGGYQLWLGGSFARGFTVSVDGHHIGEIADALDPIGDYERIGSPITLAPGRHTITVTYPHANLSPGNADSEVATQDYTALSAIALAPSASRMRYVRVSPAHADSLCGRTLDWIEVVAPA